MANALIIFVRNPVLGKVKTRLAKTMGDAIALRIYKKLLAHTHKTVKNIPCHKFIFYADGININDNWPADIYLKEEQAAGDLGEKMGAAFEKIFGLGFNKAVIIGSDCYDLTASIINDAFTALDKNDIVLGPATDGGYYLLGQKELHPSLFKIKQWSTPTVLEETILACNTAGLDYILLAVLNDVDEEKDVYFPY